MARSRRSRNQSVIPALLPGVALALVLWSPGQGAAAAAGAAVGRRPLPKRWAWRGGRQRSEARAAGGEEAAGQPEEEVEEEEEKKAAAETEELGRLKANAAAAWLVNITLVVWIVYLYQRTPSETPSEQIISLLSQELADESTALTSDRKLKEDLKQAETLASNAKSLEGAAAAGGAEPSVLARLRALLASREAELRRSAEATERDLRQAAQRPEVQRQRLLDDSVLGPLTSSASGVLAGLDVTIAAQTISLALLFSVATSRLRQPAPGPEGAEAAAGGRAQAAGETAEERERRLRGKQVLRFYGRWDDDREWVLLESVALQGAGNTVIGSVRSARGWMGSWSDRIITSLVARSARGLVRRRGWKRIVEQTMAEVGRTFSLGYLVETAADKASPRIEVDSEDKKVLEVPSHIVLDP